MIPFKPSQPVWATDDSGHGQDPHLTDVALLVLAREVIDRLSLIAQHSSLIPHSQEIEGFGIALVEPSPEEAKLILLRAHANGATHKELCLDYLCTAARLLGEWWDHDIIDFFEMTLATGRLLHFLRDLRDILPEKPVHNGHEALIVTVPKEQHTLGACIAAELLRREGWSIDLKLGLNEDEICKIAHRGAYPIIGLSASGTRLIPELARTVVGLRVAAPHAQIFVSGHIVEMEPDIATRIGADASGTDIDDCLKALDALARKLRVVVPIR
ncbi:cobalamin B12-binding domain-containing protein [Marivita sp. S6314]|uniref:cobalamin B12-binding domain-containing protein n=1 Tax=Marivita sp. S6314 TaxID=2926406 RepID=UPI001FF3D90D|nr:cobalamin B12-binding domain-containing protein [Marivita sp. S6314]